jgi:hypothetical protein
MGAPIRGPAKSEVRSGLRFINAKGARPGKMHKQIFAVHADVMNQRNVSKWCREFSEGRTYVHDE